MAGLPCIERSPGVFVAPASRRHFCDMVRPKQLPAKCRRYEKPAWFAEMMVVHHRSIPR
jgi:hypothetical protein